MTRSENHRPSAGLDTATASRQDEALSREKELAQVTLAAIGEGVIRTDTERRIDYMNPAAERLTGWTLAEAAGREITDVYQVAQEASRRPRRDPVAVCLAEKRAMVPPGLFTLRCRGGDELVIRDSVSPLLGPGEQILGAVVVFRDLTRIRGLEREMVYLTSHDTLTGLLNRQEFEIYLEAALEGARDQGASHVLLFLDLWEFKLINDSFGLVAGDELLRQIADLLRTKVGERGILGRFGGDNFTILLENATVEEAHDLARDLRRSFRDFRFTWGGQHLEVGASAGVVPITAMTESVSQLLKAADAASYLAQRRGRNKIHLYVSDDAAVVERYGRFDWVQRIRNALTEDRF
ncbi:MAG: diguanylate cyclase, partial [Thermoanaerobaculia bacterium]